MKDRMPENPGRVELVPVPGQANVFDVKMRDDPTQEGDAPVKKTLLTDQTAIAFGLDPETALPTEALAKLAYAAQYVWYKATGVHAMALAASAEVTATNSSSPSSAYTLYYTKTLTVNPVTGSITMGSVSSISVSYYTYTPLEQLRGSYWSTTSFTAASVQSAVIYYSPSDAAYRVGSLYGGYSTHIYGQKVSYSSPTGTSLVFDPDANKYPENGVFEGNIYTRIGDFREAALSLPAFVTGKYVGTGSSNTQSIDLGFKPSVLIVSSNQGRYTGEGTYMVTTDAQTAQNSSLALTASGFRVTGSFNRSSSESSENPFRWIAWR